MKFVCHDFTYTMGYLGQGYNLSNNNLFSFYNQYSSYQLVPYSRPGRSNRERSQVLSCLYNDIKYFCYFVLFFCVFKNVCLHHIIKHIMVLLLYRFCSSLQRSACSCVLFSVFQTGPKLVKNLFLNSLKHFLSKLEGRFVCLLLNIGLVR